MTDLALRMFTQPSAPQSTRRHFWCSTDPAWLHFWFTRPPTEEEKARIARAVVEACAGRDAVLALLPGSGEAARCACGGRIEGWHCQDCRTAYAEIDGRLTPAPAAPEGMVMVPREPTAAMHNALTALGRAMYQDPHERDATCFFAIKAYRAMLSAAKGGEADLPRP